MQQRREGSGGDRLGQEDDEVRSAIRFAVVVTAVAVGFLVLAALWASTCDGAAAIDTAACGMPERSLLAAGAPLILLGGGLWSFVRTYRVWRRYGTWWGWHGAGWFLLTMMILVLMMGAPVIVGVAAGG